MFRFWKSAKAIANVFMLFMTWRWFHQGFGLEFDVSCLVLSSMWMTLTFAQVKHLMRSYATILSRLQMQAPIWLGFGLNIAALATTSELVVRLLAVAGLVGWAVLYSRYLQEKKDFFAHGHGVLPQGIMINPPAGMLPPGSILLMTGIPEYIGEAVGHGEIVIPDGDKKWAFSTYMKFGVVLNPLEEVLVRRARRGITVGLAPVVPWTDEQCKMSLMVAKGMQRQNKEWVVRQRAKREKLLDSLPLPKALRSILEKCLLPITGYDWFGLVFGRTKMTRFTCVGSVQELLWRMGITLDHYFGTGLLGLGTTILDPVMPARFFNLKSYRMITEADHKIWLATQNKSH
jgi:hypothetical protein